MKTKAQLEARITELEVRHLESVSLRDELKEQLVNLRKDYEGALKDVAAARQEASLTSENLARALGYIDRINDQEPARACVVPQEPPYQQPRVELPRGPQMRSPPSPDIYSSMSRYR